MMKKKMSKELANELEGMGFWQYVGNQTMDKKTEIDEEKFGLGAKMNELSRRNWSKLKDWVFCTEVFRLHCCVGYE